MLTTIILYLKFLNGFFYALYRDLIGIKKLIEVKKILKEFEKDKSNTNESFNKLVRKHPNKACIVFNDETWTFKEVIWKFLYAFAFCLL